MDLYLHLDRKKYGFGEDVRVDVNPRRVNIRFAPQAQEIYDMLLLREYVGLNSLLDNTGFIVNSSMVYDPEAGCSEAEENAKTSLKLAGDYKPSGDETLRGICGDSGDLIRTLLYNFRMPDTIKYLHVSTKIGSLQHDNTVVFDVNSGNWAVINSKSPRIEHNLVAKEDLGDMGNVYNPNP